MPSPLLPNPSPSPFPPWLLRRHPHPPPNPLHKTPPSLPPETPPLAGKKGSFQQRVGVGQARGRCQYCLHFLCLPLFPPPPAPAPLTPPASPSAPPSASTLPWPTLPPAAPTGLCDGPLSDVTDTPQRRTMERMQFQVLQGSPLRAKHLPLYSIPGLPGSIRRAMFTCYGFLSRLVQILRSSCTNSTPSSHAMNTLLCASDVTPKGNI